MYVSNVGTLVCCSVSVETWSFYLQDSKLNRFHQKVDSSGVFVMIIKKKIGQNLGYKVLQNLNLKRYIITKSCPLFLI